MTSRELGKLTAALALTKSAARGDALSTLGRGILRLVKDVGGHRLHEAAAVPKMVRRHLEHAERLGQVVESLKAQGATTADLQAAGQRLARAREALEAARLRHRRNLGLLGAGAGAGAASTLLASRQSPPPGYVPGYQTPPAPIYIAAPKPAE